MSLFLFRWALIVLSVYLPMCVGYELAYANSHGDQVVWQVSSKALGYLLFGAGEDGRLLADTYARYLGLAKLIATSFSIVVFVFATGLVRALAWIRHDLVRAFAGPLLFAPLFVLFYLPVHLGAFLYDSECTSIASALSGCADWTRIPDHFLSLRFVEIFPSLHTTGKDIWWSVLGSLGSADIGGAVMALITGLTWMHVQDTATFQTLLHQYETQIAIARVSIDVYFLSVIAIFIAFGLIDWIARRRAVKAS